MTEGTIDTLMPSAIIPMMKGLSTLISLTGKRFKRASEDVPHQLDDASLLGAGKRSARRLPATGSLSGTSQCSHALLA